jgi:competence protein ComEA
MSAPEPGKAEDSPTAKPPAFVAQQRLAIAGVLGAVAIGTLGVFIAVSGSASTLVEGPVGSTGLAASGDPLGAAGSVGEVVVDVAGAVVKPGVYRLKTGARVADAVDAAGGFSPRVDVDRVAAELNLAASLPDGARVRVPSRDDAAPAGGTARSSTAPGSGSGLVNLNTATEAELDALPGIGPVTAGKIISSRSDAPFTTIDELQGRGLVGEKTFEKLKPLVTVG